MPARVRRPGALQELPLELFVPSEYHVAPASPFKTSSKRARSPSVLNSPMSPAKRRILNDEGVLFASHSARSPERSKGTEYLSFGMLSPRKLEFGRVDLEMKTPSESEVHKVQTPTTPRAQRIAGPTRKLAPSPELVSSPPSAKRREKSSASSDSSFSPCNVVSSSLPSPLRVPSALPSWSERQSMHYPGFDVHQESFVELLEDRARREVADEDDEDDTKENMPPKRRHKTIILEAPAFAKREGSPSTPRRNEPSKVSSTPRSATPKLSRGAATPSIHLMPPPPFPRHISPEKSEIKDRKRAMEQEVDEAVASDDEDL